MPKAKTELFRRPMARVTRVSLFSREIRVGLSSAAIDLLFESAEKIIEGQFFGLEFRGSTMLSWSPKSLKELVSDPLDVSTLEEFAKLLKDDDRFLRRAKEIGRKGADESAGVALEKPKMDIRAKVVGSLLNVDIDIEAKRLLVRAI